jgi:hypothetical protein
VQLATAAIEIAASGSWVPWRSVSAVVNICCACAAEAHLLGKALGCAEEGCYGLEVALQLFALALEGRLVG